MNRLTIDAQVRVVSALVEGNSIRATVRMTGVAKNTYTSMAREMASAGTQKTVTTFTTTRGTHFGEHWDKMWDEFHLMMKDVFK